MKLKYKSGNTTDTINIVTAPPSMHRLALRYNDQTYYAKLGEVNHPEASNLKVRRDGKTFATIKNYNPLTFDECGNIWKRPSASTGLQSVNGKLVCVDESIGEYARFMTTASTTNFEFGTGQDFTFEIIVAFPIQEDFYKALFGLRLNTDTPQEYRIIATPENELYFLFLNDGNVAWRTEFSPAITDNINRHVAFCYNHNSQQCYSFFNGSQYAVKTLGDTLPYAQVKSMYIQRLSGAIDEVRVSTGIVRYTGDFTPPTSFEVDEYTKALLHF